MTDAEILEEYLEHVRQAPYRIVQDLYCDERDGLTEDQMYEAIARGVITRERILEAFARGLDRFLA